MARALLTAREDLDDRLGGDGAALRAELRRLAEAWAAGVAPGPPPPVVAPADLVASVREALAAEGEALLVASADTPRLRPEHARMALADLEAGADASFGPGMDGGWYLVALARPHEALMELLAEPDAGADVMGRTLGIARESDLHVGLLRMERLLRTPRDALALQADPLTPEPVRAALRGMGYHPHHRPAPDADL